MADAVDIAQQLVGFKEDAVTEVVRLDARLRQRVQRVIGGYGVHIVLQGGGVVLPAQPRLCRFDAGGFIGAVQARPRSQRSGKIQRAPPLASANQRFSISRPRNTPRTIRPVARAGWACA
ncbi:hypothetical protein G6F35_016376 [Rhizopus arrhizus]|nr:hypothetical protein G6F35_016376 [Rhizopus arrhizus]